MPLPAEPSSGILRAVHIFPDQNYAVATQLWNYPYDHSYQYFVPTGLIYRDIRYFSPIACGS